LQDDGITEEWVRPMIERHSDSANSLQSSGEAMPAISPIVAGLTCKCPRCGKGALYQGFLTLRPNCAVCELDYGFIDAGDGPAIFVIMIAGFIVVGAALAVEMIYQPPFWVHAVLWLPLILATTLLPLRLIKAILIALLYHHKAAEGRLIERKPS
jgi:uncharacterized protein (DUF983 family)